MALTFNLPDPVIFTCEKTGKEYDYDTHEAMHVAGCSNPNPVWWKHVHLDGSPCEWRDPDYYR